MGGVLRVACWTLLSYHDDPTQPRTWCDGKRMTALGGVHTVGDRERSPVDPSRSVLAIAQLTTRSFTEGSLCSS